MKAATNRTNLEYAHELKRRGFPTAVHALPKEIRDYVDELLKKGWQIRTLSNELNKKYALEIEMASLKPITRTSLTTYRNKYWRKTPAFSEMTLYGDEKTKKDVEKVLKRYNAYKQMVKLAKRQTKKALLIDKKEDAVKMPTKRGDEARKLAFGMHKNNLEAELLLGIRKKVPEESLIKYESSVATKPEKKNYTKEYIAELREALDAIEKKGKYAKPKITGEPFGRKKRIEDLKKSQKKKIFTQPTKPQKVARQKQEPVYQDPTKEQVSTEDNTPLDDWNEFHPSRRKKR